MNRKEFLKMCGILGVGIPAYGAILSCEEETLSGSYDGKVLIIGAGAAGLSAAYLLNQQGVEFEILEASANYGGRMKLNKTFADFPIPLGAEWLHVGTNVFTEIVNDSSVQVDVDMASYKTTDSYGTWNGSTLALGNLGAETDKKFINSGWLDFYEQYILPSVTNKIKYNEVVQSIDYSNGNQVIVKTTDNTEYIADKVILTAPVKVLQSGDITFNPALPDSKTSALEKVTVWDGFKAFFEFSESFYPTYLEVLISPASAGQKGYYDAAYGQSTTKNILGLFAVGTGAQPFNALSGDTLKDHILNELDEIFDGKATSNYIKHIVQDWNDEPYIKGAYVNDEENWRRVSTLGESVNDILYFAGTSYTDGEDWGSVHTAAQSAKTAVNAILQG